MIKIEEYISEENEWICQGVFYNYEMAITYELNSDGMGIIFSLYRNGELIAVLEHHNHLNNSDGTTCIYGRPRLPECRDRYNYGRWIIDENKK